MSEFEAVVTRKAHGTESANVLDHGRPLLVIRDIPGPEGIPLMNTPWRVLCAGKEIASGITDLNGAVRILNRLEADETYELEYPGRSVQIIVREPDDIASVGGLQQRLIHLGYGPGPIDGQFGPRTRTALMHFQLDHDLVVDGIYGPKSQAKLAQVFEG